MLAQRLLQVVQEQRGHRCGLVAHDELDDRDPGRDVDRGELPHRADALEPADVEGVQGYDLARAGWRTGRTRTGPPSRPR